MKSADDCWKLRNLHVPGHPADVCHSLQAPAAQQARLGGHHLLSPGSQGPAVGGAVVEGAKGCNPRGSPGACNHVFKASKPATLCEATSEFNLSKASPKEVLSIKSAPNMAQWWTTKTDATMLRCYFNCYQLPLTRLLTWKGVRSRDFGTKAFSKTWTYWRPNSLDQGFWEFMNVCQCLVATGSKNNRLVHCGKIGAIFLEVLCRKVYGVYIYIYVWHPCISIPIVVHCPFHEPPAAQRDAAAFWTTQLHWTMRYFWPSRLWTFATLLQVVLVDQLTSTELDPSNMLSTSHSTSFWFFLETMMQISQLHPRSFIWWNLEPHWLVAALVANEHSRLDLMRWSEMYRPWVQPSSSKNRKEVTSQNIQKSYFDQILIQLWST